MTVTTGLDRLVADKFSALRNKKVALLAHSASVDSNLGHILDLCRDFDVDVRKLFAPEHGFFAAAQDMIPVANEKSVQQHVPIISLYGKTKESLYVQPSDLSDVDVLLCDLQDVGSRYYTYANTIIYALEACRGTNTLCMVLDRPNPLGGLAIEGNIIRPGFHSFVGEGWLANRHALTMGEIVLAAAAKQVDTPIEIVKMANWRREYLFSDTGLPWVMPSPNMPTEDTALVYPGGCLFEGTNLSEGRGTTRPFELVGAPYIDDPRKFADLISPYLGGAFARALQFTPHFQKHAGQMCGGVQIHITDKHSFMSLRAGVAILWAARQFPGFAWRTEAYEFVSDILAVDLLFGDDQPRIILEKDGSVDDVMQYLAAGEQQYLASHSATLIY